MSVELWSAIRECIDDETLTRTGRSVGDIASGHVTDAVLALPEMAALLADREQYARRRAAEELRAAAKRYLGQPVPATHVPTVWGIADQLNARADALDGDQ